MAMSCKHMNFAAKVNVARLSDSGRFVADITIECAECHKPFQFRGLHPGMDTDGAHVSLDGLEARIAIVPQVMVPPPFEGVTGFSIARRN